jgi:hypothetical protein
MIDDYGVKIQIVTSYKFCSKLKFGQIYERTEHSKECHF